MPGNNLSSDRHRPREAWPTGTVSIASIGASLSVAYPIDHELSPELQAALAALPSQERALAGEQRAEQKSDEHHVEQAHRRQ